MNLEWPRVAVTGVLLVHIAIVGTGCAMDAVEEQAPSPMASDAESTDWELLGNSPDMQHHSENMQFEQANTAKTRIEQLSILKKMTYPIE